MVGGQTAVDRAENGLLRVARPSPKASANAALRFGEAGATRAVCSCERGLLCFISGEQRRRCKALALVKMVDGLMGVRPEIGCHD